MLVLYQVLPHKVIVDLEKKNICNWRLINSLCDDCVGAADKQETPVNNVITWDTGSILKYFHATDTWFSIQHKTLTGRLLREIETLV